MEELTIEELMDRMRASQENFFKRLKEKIEEFVPK